MRFLKLANATRASRRTRRQRACPGQRAARAGCARALQGGLAVEPLPGNRRHRRASPRNFANVCSRAVEARCWLSGSASSKTPALGICGPPGARQRAYAATADQRAAPRGAQATSAIQTLKMWACSPSSEMSPNPEPFAVLNLGWLRGEPPVGRGAAKPPGGRVCDRRSDRGAAAPAHWGRQGAKRRDVPACGGTSSYPQGLCACDVKDFIKLKNARARYDFWNPHGYWRCGVVWWVKHRIGGG